MDEQEADRVFEAMIEVGLLEHEGDDAVATEFGMITVRTIFFMATVDQRLDLMRQAAAADEKYPR